LVFPSWFVVEAFVSNAYLSNFDGWQKRRYNNLALTGAVAPDG
jgi:hypothetical protein